MKYILAAAAAALVAIAIASVLLREPAAPPPPPVRGTLAERFPLHTAAFRRAAREDARWKEKRGHAYSLEEREETFPDDDPRWIRILAGRPKERPLPATCYECHAAKDIAGTRQTLGCPDCHDPATAALRLTRTAPRTPASFQDLRTVVCAQCHRDYAGAGWPHAETGAHVVRVEHPQFEMFSRGIHARAGAACPDCHMPLERRGALRITDHNARNPLENTGRACQPCHRDTAAELRARIERIERNTDSLLQRAEDALIAAIDAIGQAQARGARVEAALRLQTEAQTRLLFVAADRSKGFHAPQEAARLLGEAIDLARQAQLAALEAGGRM
jgi:formate-dependent nitrite reductase cytochrome c552 subunit